jgi:hypothetical protein
MAEALLKTVVPILAAITQEIEIHCKNVNSSARNINPERAANAGSRLIRILNVLAGSLFNAIISKENGNALDKIATPRPFTKIAGVRLNTAPSHIVKG